MVLFCLELTRQYSKVLRSSKFLPKPKYKFKSALSVNAHPQTDTSHYHSTRTTKILATGALSLYHTIYWSFKQDVCLTALHYMEKSSNVSNTVFDILQSAVDYRQQPHHSMSNSKVWTKNVKLQYNFDK
jgi:hypothetical protein